MFRLKQTNYLQALGTHHMSPATCGSMTNLSALGLAPEKKHTRRRRRRQQLEASGAAASSRESTTQVVTTDPLYRLPLKSFYGILVLHASSMFIVSPLLRFYSNYCSKNKNKVSKHVGEQETVG